MTASTTPEANRPRISDEQVARDVDHARAFRMTVEDVFLMPAGYPSDLRDARVERDAERARADALEARLASARADTMEVVAWQWRRKGNPWLTVVREEVARHRASELHGNGEIRPLYAAISARIAQPAPDASEEKPCDQK